MRIGAVGEGFKGIMSWNDEVVRQWTLRGHSVFVSLKDGCLGLDGDIFIQEGHRRCPALEVLEATAVNFR